MPTSCTPNRNTLRIWDLGDGFTMMIGPNRAALILEVGYVESDLTMVIIHANASP